MLYLLNRQEGNTSHIIIQKDIFLNDDIFFGPIDFELNLIKLDISKGSRVVVKSTVKHRIASS